MKSLSRLFFVVVFLGLSISCFGQDSRYIVFLKRNEASLRSASRAQLFKSLKSEFAKSVNKLAKYTKRDSEIEKLWSSNAIILTIDKKDVVALRKDPNVLGISKANEEYSAMLGKNELPDDEVRRAAQWGVKQIKAPKVWKELQIDGGGVLVGCIDSGIMAKHPAFKGQIIQYKDFTRHGNSKIPSDGLGHGTHVAGIIAGNKSGIGVAPGAKLIVAKIFDNNGRTTLEAILKAMQWMLEPSKKNPDAAPRVVNSSWNSKNTNTKQFWNILNTWRAAGIIPVFGAGNNGNMGGKVGAPANYPQSLAVGATQKGDKYFIITSQGPANWNGQTYIKPDLMAPGRDIRSASNKGGTVSKSGTSMAAPHVTGVIALMLEANPLLSSEEIIKILKETAVDIGDDGPDNLCGYGRVDAYRAVQKAAETFDFEKSVDYLNVLTDQEQSLTGDENNTCLSENFAYYLVNYGRSLNDDEFEKLYAKIKAEGSEDSKQLIYEIKKVRKFEKLQN